MPLFALRESANNLSQMCQQVCRKVKKFVYGCKALIFKSAWFKLTAY